MTGIMLGWLRGFVSAPGNPAPRTQEQPFRFSDSRRLVEGPSPWLCAATDIGSSRDTNEDAFCVDPCVPAFSLADGLGGHASGEIASRIAADASCRFVAERLRDGPLSGTECLLLAADALHAADSAVVDARSGAPGLEGMAAAITAAFVAGGAVYAASLGDVRCYVWSNGHLVQLTRDQTPVSRLMEAGVISPEESRCHPERHFIDQAAGLPPVYPVGVSCPLGDAARVLLCSDGVWSALPHAEIERILSGEGSMRQLATQLLNRALFCDGRDNLGLILYEHSSGGAR